MTRISSLVISLVTILIGSATLATNLQAQDDDAITVTVPFRFTAGTETIAPGTYQFSTVVSDPFLLTMVNVKTGDKEMFLVRPERQHGIEQRGRLVFRDWQGNSVLNEIHFPGTGTFSEVIERHGARRMVAKKSSPGNANSVAQR
jgi:hypothetical protein